MFNKLATVLLLSITSISFTAAATAQTATPAPAGAPGRGAPTPEMLAQQAATQSEWKRELGLLMLKGIRPGAATRDPADPHYVNYVEVKANPYPLPDPLIGKDGKRVTTLAQWKTKRRPEVVQLVNEQLYGIVPKNLPKVSWKVTSTDHETIEGVAVITKHLTGHVDNHSAPSITVDIMANVTTPVRTEGHKVPVVIAINNLRPFFFPAPAAGAAAPPRPVDPTPDYRKQILDRGWGFVVYDPTSVQADNGAGLTKGIIGLANKGQPRSLSDWGALRAWGWGASRVLDYLATDKDTDAKKVGIFGHSRYGKAALVAMAYDQRFAVGFISSSGAGGAAPYRRHWGEQVENVAATNEFHWMAGNFMKFAADPLTPDDLGVDSDSVIAMVAPRPLFVSGGMSPPEQGKSSDAWVDAHGMWMATDMAGDVYALYGKKPLPRTFPARLSLSDSGDLAFRQHDQGHTPNPNWSYFLDFAGKQFKKG